MREKFKNARKIGIAVHYWHLLRWAQEGSKIYNVQNFKASSTFLSNFKKTFNVTSRKITKFVSTKHGKDEEQIQQTAKSFVKSINNLIARSNFSPSEVWNTDQSRFEYEMTSARTLSTRGEKETYCLVQSINDTTHSYTVQILILMNETLGKKLYVFKKMKEHLDLK